MFTPFPVSGVPPQLDMAGLEPRLLQMGAKVVDFGCGCWTDRCVGVIGLTWTEEASSFVASCSTMAGASNRRWHAAHYVKSAFTAQPSLSPLPCSLSSHRQFSEEVQTRQYRAPEVGQCSHLLAPAASPGCQQPLLRHATAAAPTPSSSTRNNIPHARQPLRPDLPSAPCHSLARSTARSAACCAVAVGCNAPKPSSQLPSHRATCTAPNFLALPLHAAISSAFATGIHAFAALCCCSSNRPCCLPVVPLGSTARLYGVRACAGQHATCMRGMVALRPAPHSAVWRPLTPTGHPGRGLRRCGRCLVPGLHGV